jgi:N-acetylglucosamine kinase-like BadF-type ATPase
MGDEGSAAWIALRALSIATQAADGRAEVTALCNLIPEYYGVNSLRELHPIIYQHAMDRARLAEIASVVGSAAAHGDQVALQIITEAALHLGNAACAVIHALNLAAFSVTVTSAGGVFKAGDLLIAPMMARIKQDAPEAPYQAPVDPPIIGAVILALQSIGIAVTASVLANIEASRSIWQNLK